MALPTLSGVSSDPYFFGMSPVWKVQTRLRSLTLAGVIWVSSEYGCAPSPPPYALHSPGLGEYAASPKTVFACAAGSGCAAGCRLEIGMRTASAATRLPAPARPHLRAARPAVLSSAGATNVARTR